MELHKHFFTCALILNAIQAFAQGRLSDSLLRIRNTCYEEPPSLFLFTAGYRCPVSKSSIINSGHGIYIESGINPGKYILKNLVLGVYAGMGFQDRFWKTSFNPHFSKDYNASVKEEQNYSALDSAVIHSSRHLIRDTKGNAAVMPGCATNSFHNYSLYYGLVLKLPFKYLPLLKLYHGITGSHYQDDLSLAPGQKGYSIVRLKRAMYGCELALLKRFKGSRHTAHRTRTVALSAYYEFCDFSTSSLYYTDGLNKTTIPLKTFVVSSFLNHYKYEVYYGFKLSFLII